MPAAAFEHVIGTIQCPRSSRAGTVRAIEKGMTAFLRASFDYQSAATPIRMTARSPLLPVLLQGIEAMMTTCSCKGDYRAFMVLLEQKVFTCGLLGAYRELAAFCGVPYWTKRACLTQATINVNLSNCGGSEKLVSSDDILQNAIAIKSFWQQSGRVNQNLIRADAPFFERGSHTHVKVGSLWQCLLNKLNATMAAFSCSHGDPPCRRGLQPGDGLPGRRRLRRKVHDPLAAVKDPLPWSAVELPLDSHTAVFLERACSQTCPNGVGGECHQT